MKDIVVINNWIDSAEKEIDAINLITTLKSAGYDICLSSHRFVSPLLQSLIDIFVYEKENYQFPESDFDAIADDELAFFYHSSPILFYKQASRKTVSFLQTISLIHNALTVCRSAGYTHFFFLEGDHLIHETDVKTLQLFKDQARDHKGCFILYTEGAFSEPFYYCEIETFLKYVPNPRNPAEFINSCRVSTGASYFFLGSYLFHYLSKYVNYIPCHNNKELFPNSQLNKYVKGKTYNYIVDVVRERRNGEITDDLYFIVDVFEKSGENLDVQIFSGGDLIKHKTQQGFHYIKLTPNLFWVKICVYEGDKLIEEREFFSKDINKTSYIEFKNK
jgi:hypothetical protein